MFNLFKRNKINKFKYRNNSDEDIKSQFLISLKNNDIDNILSILSEVFLRLKGIHLYEEQILAVKEMSKGNFVEVKTGEGKSIINVLASLCFLTYCEKVYIVSVNDYLAERDYEKQKDIYEYLGITIAFNSPSHLVKSSVDKKNSHEAQITYSSSQQLIFDYLRYRLGKENYEVKLDGVIVDEADFVLIDNANSQFSISDGETFADMNITSYQIAKEIFHALEGAVIKNKLPGGIDYEAIEADYIVDKIRNTCLLTDKGLTKAEKYLSCENLTDNRIMYSAILNTIEANCIQEKEKDYIVEENKVIPINTANGRKMMNSKKNEGLQIALEIKEGVPVSPKVSNVMSLSYQIFYNKFKRLYGLSGTLKESEEEFLKIYNATIKVIPTHNKVKREDKPDIIYKTYKDKLNGLKNFIKSIKGKTNPILVVTKDDAECQIVNDLLQNEVEGKLLQVINSYNYEEVESEYIGRAGKKNTITISTVLCGRGTDILIDKEVEEAGGLMVISLNHFLNKRIDNQVKGRSGRVGQKGETQFLISIKDEVFDQFNITEREYYLSLNEEKFMSPKVQSELRKKVIECQNKIEQTMRVTRSHLYSREFTLDLQYENIFNILSNKNDDEIIDFFIAFTEEELNTIRKEKTDCNFLGREVKSEEEAVGLVIEVRKMLENVKLDIGRELFSKVAIEILRSILRGSFHSYKDQIEEMSRIYDFNSESTQNNFVRFVSEADKFFNTYKKYAIYTTLNGVLTIKRD